LELPGLTIPLAGSSLIPGLKSVALLVNETGGDIFLAQPSTLDDALSCAVTRLRMRYMLAYAPTIFLKPQADITQSRWFLPNGSDPAPTTP
jgi:hypothetical protein